MASLPPPLLNFFFPFQQDSNNCFAAEVKKDRQNFSWKKWKEKSKTVSQENEQFWGRRKWKQWWRRRRRGWGRRQLIFSYVTKAS